MSGFGRKHDCITQSTIDARSEILDAVNKVARIPALLEALEPPRSRPSKEAVLGDLEAWENYASDLQKFIAFVKREEENKNNPMQWVPYYVLGFNTVKPATVVCDKDDCPCKANAFAVDATGRRLWLGKYYYKPAIHATLCDVCYSNMLCNEM